MSKLSPYQNLYKFLGFDVSDNCSYQTDVFNVILKNDQELSRFFGLLSSFCLTYEQIALIDIRYGLSNGAGLTLREISKKIGKSDEYVRNQLTISKRKMMHRLNLLRTVDLFEKGGTIN